MKRHFLDTSLGQVHYLEDGSPSEKTIVLLHQTPRSIDEFAEIIPIVAERLHVVAIDNPGYGCSDIPDRQPTIEDFAHVVVGVLDHLGIARASLVGHHTGVLVAVEVAATHPDRVDKMVLSGPMYVDEAMRKAWEPLFVQWHVKPDGSHLSEKWKKFSDWTPEPGLVHRMVRDLVRAGETSEYGHFAALNYHMEDRLPLVDKPALLIYGKTDPFVQADKNNVFRETLPVCKEIFLDGGVFLPNEAAEAYAEAVLEFVR